MHRSPTALAAKRGQPMAQATMHRLSTAAAAMQHGPLAAAAMHRSPPTSLPSAATVAPPCTHPAAAWPHRCIAAWPAPWRAHELHARGRRCSGAVCSGRGGMDGEACKGAPEVPAVAGSARGGGGAGDAAQEVPAVAASACGGGGAGDATQEVPAAAAGGHRTRVSDGKAAAQAANASGSSRTASLGAPESTSTFIADTATESTAARPASTSNARQALTGTPAAGERQVAKLTFVVLWLASFAACFHMLASLDELPPLDEAVPHVRLLQPWRDLCGFGAKSACTGSSIVGAAAGQAARAAAQPRAGVAAAATALKAATKAAPA
eukprot:364759-Chlamydomonas_euryale.AAC.21